MAKVRCQDCGEIQECKKSEIDDTSCDCGGDLAELNSKADTWEPTKCPICDEEVDPDGDECFNCDECDNENLCTKCCVQFDNVGLVCKDCINIECKKQLGLQLGGETKVEYVEKIVEKPVEKLVYVDKEGTPIDTSFNPTKKSRFD